MGKPKQTVSDSSVKQIYGKKVKYIALAKGAFRLCKRCETKKRFAMLSEYNGNYYCSELCVKQDNNLGD